jgi:hypothetical protein
LNWLLGQGLVKPSTFMKAQETEREHELSERTVVVILCCDKCDEQISIAPLFPLPLPSDIGEL